MLVLLSPAKKILKNYKAYTQLSTQPAFLSQTQLLLEIMQKKTQGEIAKLMGLSTELAQLNYERYQHFGQGHADYPAVLLFQGDVYQGLQASQWDEPTLHYAQKHLRILSGLYGLLNPLDLIEPYRLEMGTRLENSKGKNLYEFWQEIITSTLNKQLSQEKNPLLLNLASTEYFKAIDTKQIQYPIVTVNFYEKKNGVLKMIGIHAKKARGLMASFIMKNQIDDLSALQLFKEAGYYYSPETSSQLHLDFVR